MLHNCLDFSLREQLLPFAPCQVLSDMVDQILSGGPEYAREWMDDIMGISLSQEQNRAITSALEHQLFHSPCITLFPYLVCLCERTDRSALARFYLEQYRIQQPVEDPGPRTGVLLREIAGRLSEKEKLPSVETDIWNYQTDQTYSYQNEKKQYSIRSFSRKIGRNMTLLKTPYGVILFDCGAEASEEGARTISAAELQEFLADNRVETTDIVAVLISHAHLDHYGSMEALFQAGIPVSRVYVNRNTQQLVLAISPEIPHVGELCPPDVFIDPNGKLKITPVPNGHILGSVCFVVSFDDVNILYTGDYCLHDQHTVKGLDPHAILMLPKVKQYGIDCLITESTYAGHSRPLSYKDARAVLNHMVSLAVKNGHKVFLPSFAIGRSQEIILSLNTEHRVLVDGLAAKLTHVYEEVSGIQIYNPNTRFGVKEGDKEYNFGANDVVVASSGMLAKNSTSANYLEELLETGGDIVVIKTGYISSEAYGNALLDRWKDGSRIFFDIPLSAHADLREINTLVESLCPRVTVAIHGDGLEETPHPTADTGCSCCDFSALDKQLNIVEPECSPEAACTPEIRKILTGVRNFFRNREEAPNDEILHTPQFQQLFLTLGLFPRHRRYLEELREAMEEDRPLLPVIRRLFTGKDPANELTESVLPQQHEEEYSRPEEESPQQEEESSQLEEESPQQEDVLSQQGVFSCRVMKLAKRVVMVLKSAGVCNGAYNPVRVKNSSLFRGAYRRLQEAAEEEAPELAEMLKGLGEDYPAMVSFLQQCIERTQEEVKKSDQ